jgi:hypothetical protein
MTSEKYEIDIVVVSKSKWQEYTTKEFLSIDEALPILDFYIKDSMYQYWLTDEQKIKFLTTYEQDVYRDEEDKNDITVLIEELFNDIDHFLEYEKYSKIKCEYCDVNGHPDAEDCRLYLLDKIKKMEKLLEEQKN